MMTDKSRRPSNDDLVATLSRLADMLKADENANKEPPHFSHYREIPKDVTTAYDLIYQGAELIHGTATKYTLVGKIDETEQKKLGADLLSGCELLASATLALLQDSSGCSRAVRRSAQRATLAIILTVIQLAASFSDHTALEENVGAQKTGAVWETCDKVLNRLVPQGNRNAIRREIFTWTRETNDSMEEFQEMIDRGSSEDDDGAIGEEMDDLFGEEDDQYSENELPVAKACVGILKCSRGTMKLTLEVCEALGVKYAETHEQGHLDQLLTIQSNARTVGEGVTDMGSLMYPPILPNSGDLEAQAQKQVEAIITLLDIVLGMEGLPSDVSELAHVLRGAVDTRNQEFLSSVAEAKKT